MTELEFERKYRQYEQSLNISVKECLEYKEPFLQKRVLEAAEYSLKAGGKRIRPVLAFAFCEACGVNSEKAKSAASAIEFMHTFSLIHDDLPCMDNDDLRRGQPSCHKKFDKATALLAGDVLAILPFEVIAKAAEKGEISARAGVKAIAYLSQAAGITGMIGGQQIDTQQGLEISPEQTLEMYSMKTSALLRAACCCGVICAEAESEEKYLKAAETYAENLGLAFQLVDDILDITSTSEVLGKPIGSDERDGKETYAAVCGIEKAREKAAEFTEKAMNALNVFSEHEFLSALTEKLLYRTK